MEEQNFSDLNSFTRFLYSSDPKPPGSINLGIDFGDTDSTVMDFLYDVFSHGIRLKFGNVDRNKFTIDHFNVIRDYIRSIGFDAILLDTYVTDDGTINKIDVGFKPLESTSTM